MSQIMADIGLSSEQIETIKSIQSKSRDEAKTVKQALNIQRKNLMDTLHKPDATKAQMETQLDAMMKLQRKVAQMRIDAIFSMRDVMTPEQWQSFQSRMKQGRQMRGHRGPGQGGPPPGDDF